MVTYFLTFLKHGFLAFGVFVIPAPEWFNYLIYKEKKPSNFGSVLGVLGA